jgi:high affinity Mn2+ porin
MSACSLRRPRQWRHRTLRVHRHRSHRRSESLGQGKRWGRPDDTFGIAGIVNGITSERDAFLNAGGLGILAGDGQLPHPGPEQILETYYSFPFSFCRVTFDYQFIFNPGYNADRGPASVVATRLHTQF